MHPNIQISDEVLDELVCGSVEPERYRAIIRALDAQPHRWRDCALAFLHEQAIGEELAAISKSSLTWDLSASDAPKTPSEVPSVRLAAIEIAQDQVHLQSQHQRSVERLFWLQKLTSLAALLLIAFTIGWLGANWGESPGSNTAGSSARGTTASSTPGETIAANQPFDRTPPQPLSHGSANNQLKNDDFWIKSVANSENQFLPYHGEMPDSLQELQRSGRAYVETIDGFFPVDLDDGSTAFVPVQQFKVVPRGQSF